MPIEEYLELEKNSPATRYEYLDGEAIAMSGGTIDHGRIALFINARMVNGRISVMSRMKA